jgi:beta-glucanase (GH16 family)
MERLSPSRLSWGAKAFLLLLVAAGLGLFLRDGVRAQSTWQLIWSDEFTGPANTGVNPSNWLYDLGTSYPGGAANWGTGEVETMTNSTANVFLDGGGHLAIRPLRDASGRWTSGRIETQRTDFQAPPGGALAVEASLQQPNVSGAAAAGYWPAFWMLGAPFRGNFNNWPGVGEIDIMEDINGRSSLFATLHCGSSPGGPCNELSGLGSGERLCAGCQTGFHTYRMELDMGMTPNQIRWFVDGGQFFTINANQVDATTWDNATDHGFFIILDVAMGGGFPAAFGAPVPTASTASGVPMLVDYVRVFQRTGPAPTPTPVPTPTPTPTPSAANLALNKPATGSTPCNANEGPAKAVNGSVTGGLTDKWCSGAATRFLQVDLGGTFSVNRFIVRHAGAGGESTSFNTRAFNIQTSTNGTSFTTVASATANTANVTTHNVTPVSARFVRLNVTTPTQTTNNAARIYEFEAYGTSASPTPTPTPTPAPTPTPTGAFTQGVDNVSATQARIWFRPNGWTAGYVIVHYLRPGLVQQNVNMTFNSGSGRWEQLVDGLSAGQLLQYSFTYQRDGVQADTGGFSWTKP